MHSTVVLSQVAVAVEERAIVAGSAVVLVAAVAAAVAAAAAVEKIVVVVGRMPLSTHQRFAVVAHGLGSPLPGYRGEASPTPLRYHQHHLPRCSGS